MGLQGNAEVAAVFEQIADLLEFAAENPFRVRAYRNAARMLAGLGRPVAAMVSRGEDLDALPGIGPDLAAKIAEIVTTGRCTLLEQLRARVSPSVGQLLSLPGIGPKRARLLQAELGVDSLPELHRAAEQGRVAGVPGFGPAMQQRILKATAAPAPRRVLNRLAQPVADELLAWLRAAPGVEQALVAGSLRRGRDTVGDIDLLVAAGDDGPVMARFFSHPAVQLRLMQGHTRASVVLRDGLQVDLRVVAPQSFGAAAVYLTGSKAHNIALRRRALERQLKLNEYGVFRGATRIAGDTEASVYAALGLALVPPELREDRGEIEAAARNGLPRLLRLQDLRGDLHAHTSDSDGRDSLEAMAAAARARGLDYLAVTEHSRGAGLVRGLDAEGLARQIERIDRFNDGAGASGITLLKGIEVDILEDGSLALPDDILARLDLVVGAVHDHFDLPRARQTARLQRATDQRHFSVLAHPSGRLIGERAPMQLPLERLLRHARQRGCFVELDAQPSRLDLDDLACQMAKAEGVLVSLASDAHGAEEFDDLEAGVRQARRGWLEAGDVLNTRPLPELRALLKPTMA